ncbi:MAG: hypothetical protein ACW990_00010 [Promethearchaeota archaeon]|jgi:hypothetical protein
MKFDVEDHIKNCESYKLLSFKNHDRLKLLMPKNSKDYARKTTFDFVARIPDHLKTLLVNIPEQE